MSAFIYLDNAATTRPFPQVVEAVRDSMQDGYFNPSSLYAPGFKTKKMVEACRDFLKAKLSAAEICFTSGGTEANNLAILGLTRGSRKQGRILYSAVEHAAVAETCRSLSDKHEVFSLPVKKDGVLDLDKARELMTPDTELICLMQVNNEVGSVQPVVEVVRLRDELCPKARIHVDGVQGFMKLPFSLLSGVDSYTISGHKIHGPKGVGALAFCRGLHLQPIVYGGKQESGLRSGTENTDGIAGLSAALQIYPQHHKMKELKQKLYQSIKDNVPQVQLNGPDPLSDASCPHILNLSFPPVLAQTMMHQLEGFGVLVSQGSACSSRQKKPITTLSAMGLSKQAADSALRFSLSCLTTLEEIEQTAKAVQKAYESLRSYTRR